MAKVQCAAQGCVADAAWGARTKPAWCQEHAREQFRTAGMEAQEDIVRASAHTLAQCLTCGTATHIKLEYALDKASRGEPPCRACFWTEWSAGVRARLGRPFEEDDVGEVRSLARQNRYDYLRPLTTPSLVDDPHLVRCTDCGRISAGRRGDIGWGCPCHRSSRTLARPRGAKRELFKESQSPALDLWDHERNSQVDWDTASIGATRKVSWRCSACGHQFTETIKRMTTEPRCPECWAREMEARSAERERLAVTPISAVPELLAAWVGHEDPATVMVADAMGLLQCPQGHRPSVAPLTFLSSGCPACRSLETRAKTQAAASAGQATTRLNPEIAAQWHPEKNHRLDVATISPTSVRDVIWRCYECSHEWNESPKARQYADSLRCPVCRSVFSSLAFVMPDLAAEWSPKNPRTAWQVRPHGTTPFIPKWVCTANPDHLFEATLTSRANGSACPECSVHGKSRIEIDHHAAATRILGPARSGTPIRTTTGHTWRVDITLETDQMRLAIEYDGSYWHRDKTDLDTRKSRDLLADGWSVVRLREHPLAPLPIEVSRRYLELTVYPTAPTRESHATDCRLNGGRCQSR